MDVTTSAARLATDGAALPDDMTVRPAAHDDYEPVAAFTRDSWDEFSDYIPDIYHDWIGREGTRTLVADAGDDIAGIAQAVLLSGHEAWAQGMRVNPDHRGQGVATALTAALFGWARDQGATVTRNMVFSSNPAGMGQSRAVGFEPVTEFRWIHPDPVPDAEQPAVPDPDAAWSCWTESDARARLSGLALDMDESWALRELTRGTLSRAAHETALLAVTRETGTGGFAYRTRTVEHDTGLLAEYGVATWRDLPAAEQVLTAIAADAASCGATETRVLIPETPRAVSDAAYLRTGLADEPDLVFGADLTGV